jgi:predicted amidohydrolase YtcJ
MNGRSTRVFHARAIVTMSGDEPEAFAVAGDEIVATGAERELAQRFPEAERVDLGDGVVVPGFQDSHLHLIAAADNLLHADLSPASVASIADIQRTVRAAAAARPAGAWVRASRYDDAKTDGGRRLTRADLDAAAPEHPVLVLHVAGHWGVVNSRALELAGLTDASSPPPGGELGRDGAGRLDGILYEQALFDLAYPALAQGGRTVVPQDSPEDRLGGVARAVERFHAAGLTAITDALVGPDDLALLREADRRGLLTLRTDALVPYQHYDLVRDLAPGAELGYGRLRLGGVKGFLDGAIGGRTCLLEQPYEGTEDDRGIQTLSLDELAEFVDEVHADGHRLAVHANGDRAIGMLLDQLEAARRAHPANAVRHRIEHCSIVNDAILARMAALGAIAVPFATYVHYHGGRLIEWYGQRRVARMFAHRSFIDAGVLVAGSSDFPCGPFEPLLALQSCVTRRGGDGVPVGAEQRIGVREALALYTTWAAQVAGRSDRSGRIAPGQLADFVVLGDDPLTVDPRALAGIPVRATYVGGARVWPA